MQDHPAKPNLSRRQRLRLCLFILPIALAPVMLLVAAFFAVPTHWFALRSGNTYLMNMGYGATLHNRMCQVLIYGDSTALVGLDPERIRLKTGLTVCNIAEFQGMTVLDNTGLVDDFLANNPRPEFILFFYTPEDLASPGGNTLASTFEAISYLLEYKRGPRTIGHLMRHPERTFIWAEQGLRMSLTRIRSTPFLPEVASIRASHDGQFPISGSTLSACDYTLKGIPPDREWITSLRTRYSHDGTRVLVDATPVPFCEKNLGFYQANFNGAIDNTPYLPLPLDSYTTDGRLHASATGARRLSDLVSAQIEGLRPGNRVK